MLVCLMFIHVVLVLNILGFVFLFFFEVFVKILSDLSYYIGVIINCF